MTPREIIDSYYDNLQQKNDKWQTFFAESITYSDAGMNINEAGCETVTNTINQLLVAVEDIRVRQIIVENDNICAVVLYSYINAGGEKLTLNVCEIWKFSDGKLNSLITYFDFTLFRKFMGF